MGRLPDGVETAALVGAGGAVGATLRYAAGLLLPGLLGTLAVNVLGSFALGALFYTTLYVGRFPRRLQLAVGTGVLSSFTTYSTFAVEAATASSSVAAGYVLATYAFGFGAVVVGRAIVGRVTRRTPAGGGH